MQKITEYRTPEGFFDADIDITKEELENPIESGPLFPHIADPR